MIIVNPEKRSDGKSSFQDLVNYIESGDKGGTKTLYTGCRGFSYHPETAGEAAKEMLAAASQNKRCKNPVFHAIMSWREGEMPTKAQVEDAIDIYLKEMGLEHCQMYYGLHVDTDNIHLHLCVNRVEPDTNLAIDPAGGWTKKANMRSARKIEIAHGWERDSGGLYEVIGGEVFEKIVDSKEPSIGAKARLAETQTAEKSAQRIAKEEYSSILFESNSWKELHEKLAKTGAKLEKRGSGCILYVGEIPIKLSSVSQKLSLKKLEKRLGNFIKRDNDIAIKEFCPQPLRKTENSEKYIAERRAFYAERKDTIAAIKSQIKSEYENMRTRHWNEREKLYRSQKSWKGKGAILNALRSAQAWEHLNEKQAFREWKAATKKELSEIYSRKFPFYEEWLKALGKEKEAHKWRYRESVPMAITGENGQEVSPKKYKAQSPFKYLTETEQWGKLNGFVYRHESGDKKIAFVDVGRRIDVVNWRDENIVLDALRLAQEKWGKCTIHGSQQYKDICVKVAAQHGINLKNPELQTAIRQEKERLGKIRAWKPEKNEAEIIKKISENFMKYHNAVGADKYRVTAFWEENKTCRAWVLDKQPGQSSVGFTVNELITKLPLIARLDDKNRHVYYTPLSEHTHHILVDDMNEDSLKALKADGYKPAVVIESSPGNFQAILNIHKLRSEFDREISNALMIELNSKYGDKNISGAVHPHRIPGTHNSKAKYKKDDGTFPEVKLIETEKCMCNTAYARTYALLKDFQKTRRQMESQEQHTWKISSITISGDPVKAYLSHAENIMRYHEGVQNWSRVDSMVAVRMHVTGYTEAEIKAAIEIGAKSIRPPEDKNKHKWSEYAKRTAKFPATYRGQYQVAEFGNKYRNYWLRIEGRVPETGKEIER